MKKTNKTVKTNVVAPQLKFDDDPGKYVDQPRELRQYEVDVKTTIYSDHTNLVHQLAVFGKKDYIIYKVNAIDLTGERYECAGQTIAKWISFDNAILFNFINEDEFKYYYDLYASKLERPKTSEKILDWLKTSRRRMGKIDESQINTDPFIKNNKRP